MGLIQDIMALVSWSGTSGCWLMCQACHVLSLLTGDTGSTEGLCCSSQAKASVLKMDLQLNSQCLCAEILCLNRSVPSAVIFHQCCAGLCWKPTSKVRACQKLAETFYIMPSLSFNACSKSYALSSWAVEQQKKKKIQCHEGQYENSKCAGLMCTLLDLRNCCVCSAEGYSACFSYLIYKVQEL